MSNMTSATVVTATDPTSSLSERQQAIDRATTVFNGSAFHREYYTAVNLADVDDDYEPVVPMDTDEGKARVGDKLEKTIEAREHHLNEILDAVEDGCVWDAAQNYDVQGDARRLGRECEPSGAFIFDGTDFSFGSPILGPDRMDDIAEAADRSNLYLVDLQLTY